jgi:plasmid stabilization system protein ParE
MSQVFLALSAKTDLLEAWSYIADQSVDAADHVLDVIDKEAQTLALQPLMGRARPDLHPDIRYGPTSSSYNLYYTVSSLGVTVVRVLHQARDVNSRLF